MGHSFVQVSGHGVRFLPSAPFALQMRGKALEATCIVDGVETEMPVDASTPRAEHPVGDVFDGPTDERWRLEVGGVYAVSWPSALVVRSWPEPEEPPFFMFEDSAGSLMYIQGPFIADDIPQREGMVGEGQREVGRGEEGELRWIDLGYDHDDSEWRQRHVVVQLASGQALVVSAQGRAATSSAIESQTLAVARSIEYRPEQG